MKTLKCLGAFDATGGCRSLAGTFEEAAWLLEQLERSEPWVDKDDLNCSIVCTMINREQHCAAWVEWRWNDSKRSEHHEYHLCARTPEARLLRWEIESYNPYFGVYPKSLSYRDGVVRLVYRDKHSSYAATMDENNCVERQELPRSNQQCLADDDLPIIESPRDGAQVS